MKSSLWCYHSNETSLAVLSDVSFNLVCSRYVRVSGLNSTDVIIQKKPFKQYFHVVMVLFLRVVLSLSVIFKVLLSKNLLLPR